MSILRLGAYAADPPALDAFHAFDPESYVAIMLINDGLIHIDEDGSIQPNLATSWERESPISVVFTLREGVTFHNGEVFDADSVVETFRAHLNPEKPSMLGGGILSPIKEVTKCDDFKIRIETHFPDAMLLQRLFFSLIYPAKVLQEHGPDYFIEHPIGTGAFRFLKWDRGQMIKVERNPEHWAQEATVDGIEIPIIPRPLWVECLEKGQLDLLLNIDANDAQILSVKGDIEVKHQPSTLSHFFLWKQEGPLADVRVRRALNQALHRGLIVEVAEHSNARMASSLLSMGQLGYNSNLKPIHYEPEQARELLAEAGYPEGFTLKGLVSASSSATFLLVREFLNRLGVRLEAEIVPRAEWMKRVVVNRMMGGTFDGHFALTNVDNPVLHGLFHHFIFLFSQGPFSLNRSEEYDKRFLDAATTLEPKECEAKLHALEAYAQEQALCLYTVQQHVYLAARKGVHMSLPASGHFNTSSFWRTRIDEDVRVAETYEPPPPKIRDESAILDLIEATSHPGIFYLPAETQLDDPLCAHLWSHLGASQQRWFTQVAPMLRELVRQAEARSHLANIMDSTSRVGIIGTSKSGRELFRNTGFEKMVALNGATLENLEVSAPGVRNWEDLKDVVDQKGSWEGPISIEEKSFYLSVARALNDAALQVGYTWIFSDFTGTEERIRSQAIRRILDHVPYGLCYVDKELVVQPGYSKACSHFFTRKGEGIAGSKFTALLGMRPEKQDEFQLHFEQIFEGWLPEEVAMAQLPDFVEVEGKVVALSGSVITKNEQHIGVLFSMIDATALREAQKEVSRIKGLVAVMREKELFVEAANAFVSGLDRLLEQVGEPVFETNARRELHTQKGVWGLFELFDLVEQIHKIEEERVIPSEALQALKRNFLDMLEDNFDIWGVRLGEELALRLSPSRLAELLQNISTQEDAQQVVKAVQDFAGELLKKPVRYLVGPLEQMCERIALREEKDIQFSFEGKMVRVPERYAEVFRALSHLLRNSITHGIESSEERRAKSSRASISLSIAENDGGYQILFTDDGRGIDLDSVVATAVAKGLLSKERSIDLNREAIIQLIFADGLSTAQKITELSGRGVGMGAIQAEVQAAGGTIQVCSTSSEGTSIEIQLPNISQTELLGLLQANS